MQDFLAIVAISTVLEKVFFGHFIIKKKSILTSYNYKVIETSNDKNRVKVKAKYTKDNI